MYLLIPQERLTIDSLYIDFNEVDPTDINGKYSHKIYGYLLPPQPGKPYYMYIPPPKSYELKVN